MYPAEPLRDVVIIGAGPIGLACGVEAERHGRSYIILEKGCLVNSIYNYPANMTFFSTSEKLEMADVPFISHSARPTRREALEYYRRVKTRWNLQVRLYEPALDVRATGTGFEVQTPKGLYPARHVIVATGFFGHANPMRIPGEDLPKVRHYYHEPHPYIDQQVVVVGAANSAVDAALEIWRKGGLVTMVIRGEEINPRVKYWIKPDIENRIREGSIRALFNSHLTAITPEAVEVQTPDGRITLPNDFVVAMTGYQPDYEWLARIGIHCTDALRMPVRDEATFESSLPGIFLAGTICGGLQTNKWFIENSIEHAAKVMDEVSRRCAAGA
ncbi:MAG: YpdA family putative bacillithiol disulfide reductase [Bacteroidia bacterium]|nr:YpdA family putative bacillithiol disulfide reductase [Bacteroidia bacterium]